MIKQQTKFKDTEIGKIPEDWDVLAIGSVGEIVGGGTPSTKNEDYFGGDIPWITPKDLSNYSWRYISKGERNITEEGLNNSSAKLLPKNAVLLTTRAPVGYVAISTNEVATNQGFHSVITNENTFAEYVYYLFKNHTKYLQANASGSTFSELSSSRLKQLRFAFPKLKEQHAIAKILSDLDAKIELNQRMNKTLEGIAQAIFKHWFIDFEFPNEEGKPYKSSGGKMKDSELGEIPEEWAVEEILNCGKIICGKTPPTADKDNYGDDIFFITIPDMRGQAFVIKTERKLSVKGASTQKKKELPSLTVCVSCIATPGLVSLTSELSHSNQQINSIVCNKDVSPFFMYFKMVDKSEEIKCMGLGGTATLNLNTGNFSRIKITVPGKATMEAFHKLVASFMEKIMSNSIENNDLCNVRDTILPKLMSGNIRIKTK